jgi:DNA-binding Lrp family transcriptional regulator
MPALTEDERRLLLTIQEGLPLTPQPYAALADQLGASEEHVMEIVRSLLARGVVKRLAAVPNHYALGIRANGMSVWDVPDDQVSEIGAKLGNMPEVSHCYRRPRRPPSWPYNLFAMVHGYSRREVRAAVRRIAQELGMERVPRDIIFSTRILKKRGTRVRASGVGASGPPGAPTAN